MAGRLVQVASKLVLLAPLIGVAFGRWGSYLGIPGTPLFMADLLFSIGGLLLTISWLLGTNGQSFRLKSGLTNFLIIIAVTTILIGILRSPGIDLLAIRDAVPFVYLAAVPVFAFAVTILGSSLVLRWLTNAALIHTLWFVPASLDLLQPIKMSSIAGVAIFTTRSDFDQLICGVSIALILINRKFGNGMKVFLVAATALGFVSSGSRAGFISGFVVLAAVAFFGRRLVPHRTKLLVFISAMFMTPAVVITGALISKSPPEWASSLMRLLPNDSTAYQTAQNTWNARLEAWQMIIDYTALDRMSSLFGRGFGSNAVLESNALIYLSGDPSVRAAHNFLITWFSMIGTVGLSLFMLWTFLVLRAGISRRSSRDWTRVIGLAIFVGLIVCGSAGVILESPFGYILLAFSAGLCISNVSRKLIIERPITLVP